jgi:hypothetical protein
MLHKKLSRKSRRVVLYATEFMTTNPPRALPAQNRSRDPDNDLSRLPRGGLQVGYRDTCVVDASMGIKSPGQSFIREERSVAPNPAPRHCIGLLAQLHPVVDPHVIAIARLVAHTLLLGLDELQPSFPAVERHGKLMSVRSAVLLGSRRLQSENMVEPRYRRGDLTDCWYARADDKRCCFHHRPN